MDIPQSDFLAKLQTVNAPLHSALTSANSLPELMTGLDILNAIVDTTKQIQADYNSNRSEPPYMAVINRATQSNPQVDGGIISIISQTEIITRRILSPNSATSFTTNTPPTII